MTWPSFELAPADCVEESTVEGTGLDAIDNKQEFKGKSEINCIYSLPFILSQHVPTTCPLY